GLAGGGDLTADRTLGVVDDTTTQRVRVSSGGAFVAARREVNFVNGANVTVTVTDDAANNRLNVSIASSGGSGGMVDPTTTLGDVMVRGAAAVQRLGVGTNGQVLTAGSASPLRVKWGTVAAGGSQTPWTSTIVGAGFALDNVGKVGVATTVSADASAANLSVYSAANRPYNDGIGCIQVRQYNNGNWRLCIGMDATAGAAGTGAGYVQAITYA